VTSTFTEADILADLDFEPEDEEIHWVCHKSTVAICGENVRGWAPEDAEVTCEKCQRINLYGTADGRCCVSRPRPKRRG
jgi:hypothetical protein